MPHSTRWLGAAAAALLATACSPESDFHPTGPAAFAAAASRGPGAVGIMSNAPSGNSILLFARRTNGGLEGPQSYPTGGTGTGGGLGSQGAIALARGGRWLLAVNAASNDVSVFRVAGGALQLTDREPSGGVQPVSIAVRENLVYVLNTGGTGNITGFRLEGEGQLVLLTESTRPLSSPAAGAAQVGFSPGGRTLVVTEKATNRITLYGVGLDGRAGPPASFPSSGPTPFGFAFDPRGRLLVSEAFGGATDASALSSYALADRRLRTLSASIGTSETAACWVVATGDGRFAYVSNTGSGSISGFRIRENGTVSLLDGDGVTGRTGAGPIDMALTRDGRLLFSLDEQGGTISGFLVRENGSLEALPRTSGVPTGANGLVAW